MAQMIDALLVSFTFAEDPDDELLIVGRKIGETQNIDIVNAIQGSRARDIYEMLKTKPGV